MSKKDKTDNEVTYSAYMLNVSSMSDTIKRRSICNKILEDRPDIVVLTETKMSPSQNTLILPSLGSKFNNVPNFD